MRAVVYARYSSDLQSPHSIEDQVRLCKERIKREGWKLTECYSDAALSGADGDRPDYVRLLADARAKRFDIVVVESLDRLSRDLQDIAGLYKILKFAGVRLVTLADGDINEMHIGLRGTMSALFLSDLSAKTSRGLRGRVEAGSAPGALVFGYAMPVKHDARGERIRGLRKIDPAQAAIVRKIFEDYASGISPRAIAKALDAAGVKPPRQKKRKDGTLSGWSRVAVDDILANPLYVGRLVWGKTRYAKDPATGRRVNFEKPRDEWIEKPVPALRIVSDELWTAVRTRQSEIQQRTESARQRLGNKGRAGRHGHHLLSGLVQCVHCTSPYHAHKDDFWRCSRSLIKGRKACPNSGSVRRSVLEAGVLAAVKQDLLGPEALETFRAVMRDALAKRHRAKGADQRQIGQEIARREGELANIITAIKAGIITPTTKAELERTESTIATLRTKLAGDDDPGVADLDALLPSMVRHYHKLLGDLDLDQPGPALSKARAAVRMLLGNQPIWIVTTKSKGKPVVSAHLAGSYPGVLKLAETVRPRTKLTGWERASAGS